MHNRILSPRPKADFEKLASAVRMVRKFVRKLHNEVPVRYIKDSEGGLEFTSPSLTQGRRERPEFNFRFMAKEVMDLAHQLKTEIEKL